MSDSSISFFNLVNNLSDDAQDTILKKIIEEQKSCENLLEIATALEAEREENLKRFKKSNERAKMIIEFIKTRIDILEAEKSTKN
jgi:hypothetical protein